MTASPHVFELPLHLSRLLQAFRDADQVAYIVGGAVRDALLGHTLGDANDIDITTNAQPARIIEVLERARIRTYDLGLVHGTVGARLPRPGGSIECHLTTLRVPPVGEGEADVTVTLTADLAKRDFTINSMAVGLDGLLIDPHGGAADLAAGRLRSAGTPDQMLGDDPLRLLRIGRFAATLGFAPDEALLEAARRRAGTILGVSRERWLAELDKLLVAPHVVRGLEVLRDCRVLGMILPEVDSMVGFHQHSPAPHKDLWAHTLAVVAHSQCQRVQRWVALIHDVGKVWTREVTPDGQVKFLHHERLSAMLFEGIAERLRFDRKTAETIAFLVAEHALCAGYTSEWTDSAVRRLARRLGVHLEASLDFAQADLTTIDAGKRERALARLDELRARLAQLRERAALTPELPAGLAVALMKSLSLAPGPAVGQLIKNIEEAVLDGHLPGAPTLETCLDWAQEHLAS